MTTHNLSVGCSVCGEKVDVKFELPDGWATDEYNGLNSEVDGVLCAKHAPIQEFKQAQCPGCVGLWGDCTLWERMADYKVGEAELKVIEGGHCPHRVNGSFSVDYGRAGAKVESVDMSDRAPDAASKAFAEAILEHYGGSE